LLIGLNRDWLSPEPGEVIARFVEDALARTQNESGTPIAELRRALLALSEAMLSARELSPSWAFIEGAGLSESQMQGLKQLVRQAELIRTEGPSSAQQLRFRHDRLRDWLLSEAALALMAEDAFSDELLADPLLAEVVGLTLVRSSAPKWIVARAATHGPLRSFMRGAWRRQTRF
ncbi:MAG TPA: hypothetical protein VF614_10185, partial [Chthoniobacteraceae bacterium]